MAQCATCGGEFDQQPGVGRPRKHCTACAGSRAGAAETARRQMASIFPLALGECKVYVKATPDAVVMTVVDAERRELFIELDPDTAMTAADDLTMAAEGRPA